MRLKRGVVGCGMQGRDCLALGLKTAKRGKWLVEWSLAGALDDGVFASELAKLVGKNHFWVSPREEGGLQVEIARAIEIPGAKSMTQGERIGFFTTQIKNCFVNETVVYGGIRVKGALAKDGVVANGVHNVGAGAIKDNVKRDYQDWYSGMKIRRPHIASTALALANAYLALYPEEKRRAEPLRLVILKGRSVYRAVLMDDWRYVDEVLLPRMEGDDAGRFVVEGRVNSWIDYLKAQHPALVEGREIKPLAITVAETWKSTYEHWDFWGEYAQERIEMTGETAQALLENRDIAPIAFGMALQGGC
ncbi:MAG: hypothetical protein ACI4R9_04640 [Kiritimatiellia bacterium]